MLCPGPETRWTSSCTFLTMTLSAPSASILETAFSCLARTPSGILASGPVTMFSTERLDPGDGLLVLGAHTVRDTSVGARHHVQHRGQAAHQLTWALSGHAHHLLGPAAPPQVAGGQQRRGGEVAGLHR